MSSLSSSSSPRSSCFRTAFSAAAPQSASRRGLLALAAAIALAPLALTNAYTYEIAILVGLNAIVCVGLNLLVGYAGQISLGHAGFYALGAYGSAVLAARYGWSPLLSIPTSILGTSLLAWLVGKPVLRLRGHYLAMATLGLGIIVSVVLANEDWLTGGPDGMSVPALFITGEKAWYWAVGVALILTVWLTQNLIDSPRGRAWRALHGSEVAAAAIGIDAARHKLAAFVLSAAIAAFAGALTAHYAGFLTPSKASFLHSVELVTMVVFGGMASTLGAVVGAAVLTTLPQLLTVFKEYEMVLFGGLLMLTMIFMPQGLVPTLEKLLAAARGKPE
jgi:branched-chain amino acid transport system permease protein